MPSKRCDLAKFDLAATSFDWKLAYFGERKDKTKATTDCNIAEKLFNQMLCLLRVFDWSLLKYYSQWKTNLARTPVTSLFLYSLSLYLKPYKGSRDDFLRARIEGKTGFQKKRLSENNFLTTVSTNAWMNFALDGTFGPLRCIECNRKEIERWTVNTGWFELRSFVKFSCVSA